MNKKTIKKLKSHLETILNEYGVSEYVIVFSENECNGCIGHCNTGTLIDFITGGVENLLVDEVGGLGIERIVEQKK